MLLQIIMHRKRVKTERGRTRIKDSETRNQKEEMLSKF